MECNPSAVAARLRFHGRHDFHNESALTNTASVVTARWQTFLCNDACIKFENQTMSCNLLKHNKAHNSVCSY